MSRGDCGLRHVDSLPRGRASHVRTNSVARPAVDSGSRGHPDFRSTLHLGTQQQIDRRPRAQRRARHAFARLDACSSMQSSFAAQITRRLLSTTKTLYRMMAVPSKGGTIIVIECLSKAVQK